MSSNIRRARQAPRKNTRDVSRMRGDNVKDDDGSQQSPKKGRIIFASGSSQVHNTNVRTSQQCFARKKKERYWWTRHTNFSTCQKKNVLRFGLVFHQIEAQDPGIASKTRGATHALGGAVKKARTRLKAHQGKADRLLCRSRRLRKLNSSSEKSA